MATESGFTTQKKFGEAQHKTIHNLGSDRYGTSVTTKALSELNAIPSAIVNSAIDDRDDRKVYIELTAHGARKGDVLRISSGALISWEFEIIEVVDADIFAILNVAESIPQLGDTAKVMRWVTSKADSEGNVNFSPGPLQYVKNGVSQQVIQDDVTPTNNTPLPTGLYFYKDGIIIPVRRDTGTPANNAPLPVELIGFDGGNINITAGDINVRLTSEGANFDSTRIGDGSGVYLKINPDGSANVIDTAVAAKLDALLLKDFATETTLAALEGKDFATEATLGSVLTQIITVAGKDFATEATLAAIETIIADIQLALGSDGTPASTRGIIIGGVDGNGDFQRVTVNAAGELLVNISTGASGIASEATLDALNDKFTNDFGAPATGIRTAAQIGNANGAADFNSGTDTAQTLRVSANLKRSGNELSYGNGAADANTLRAAIASGHGLATESKQDAEIIQATAINTAIGTQADIKEIDPNEDASLISIQKGALELLSGILSALGVVPTPIVLHSTDTETVLDSVATVFTPPVGARYMQISNNAADTANPIRWTKFGETVSATNGNVLIPTAPAQYIPAGEIEVIGVGGSADVTVTWYA